VSFSVKSNEEDWESEIKENDTHVSNYVGGRQDHRASMMLPEKPLVEQYRPTVQYLTLDIPMEDVYFVDDAESLRFCQKAVSKVSAKKNSTRGYETLNVEKYKYYYTAFKKGSVEGKEMLFLFF
jgi:hypothetical protein